MKYTPRRQFLRTVGVCGMASLAGCRGTDGNANTDDDGDEDGSTNGYRVYANTLAAVARPFEQSATEVTREMVESVATQSAKLAKTAVGGSSTAAIKDILETVRLSYEQLRKGERAFALEMVRAQAKEAAASFDVEVYYNNDVSDRPVGIGRSWNPSRPYYPLFAVLEADFRRLAETNSKANRRRIRKHADAVESVFEVGLYIPLVEDVTSYSGAKPLLQSLIFLRDTAKWIRKHIQVERTTQTPDDDGGIDRFVLDFEDPPEKLRPHVETVDGNPKLVMRGESVWYSLPDLSDWETIEYKITGQSAGNTFIEFDSAAAGSYGSFLGIRPWMRWRSAVENFNGGDTYPAVDWGDAQPNTEYRVVIERTGGATGTLTVYGPGGDTVYSLGTERVFGVFENADEATFVPSAVRFSSNKSRERAMFDEIVVETG